MKRRSPGSGSGRVRGVASDGWRRRADRLWAQRDNNREIHDNPNPATASRPSSEAITELTPHEAANAAAKAHRANSGP
jgi:hypothetical protein